MAQKYLNKEIETAITTLRDACSQKKISVEDLNAMVNYVVVDMPEGVTFGTTDCNETKEERFSPHTPFYKEEKDDNSDNIEKKLKKKTFLQGYDPPLLEEVVAYHKTLKGVEFTAEEFYDYYEVRGWKLKDGELIFSWQALMRSWQRRNLRAKEHPNEECRIGRKQSHTSQSPRRMENERRAIQEYLDEYYPLEGKTAGVAPEEKSLTIAQLANKNGKALAHHLVMKYLFMLGKALNSSKRTLQPEALHALVDELLNAAFFLTMDQLQQFFSCIKQGKYGSFHKGLLLTDLMSAFSRHKRALQNQSRV